MGSLPRRQRVAAYAVVLRERAGAVEVLLSRLAARISRTELWTLPGGGLDHGEDPRAALVREIHEETGLSAEVGETAHVYSAHLPRTSRENLDLPSMIDPVNSLHVAVAAIGAVLLSGSAPTDATASTRQAVLGSRVRAMPTRRPASAPEAEA